MNTRLFYRVLVLSLTAASVLAVLLVAGQRLGYTEFDDAYIFSRYARHFLEGQGFSWNAGEGPVFGCTSLLYLFIHTLLRALLPLSDAALLTGASFTAGLLSCLALSLGGYLALEEPGPRGSWIHLLVIPAVVLSPAFRFHSFSGMETTLALLCNSLLVCFTLAYGRRPGKLAWTGCLIAAYLSYLARPDNLLYGLLVPPLFFFSLERRRVGSSVLYAAAFLVLLSVDAAVKKSYFGDALPLAFYAKRGGFFIDYRGAFKWNALSYILRFMKMSLPFLISILLFGGRKSITRMAVFLAPVILTGGYFSTFVQIMGTEARFYYPALPFVVIAAFHAIDSGHASLRAGGASADRLFPLRLFGIYVLILLAVSGNEGEVFRRLWERYRTPAGLPETEEPEAGKGSSVMLPAVGWWKGIQQMADLVERFPPAVTVAMTEYGLVGAAAAEVRIIDLCGLNDRITARRGFEAPYFFSLHPDFVWLPHSDYAGMRRTILGSPEFQEDYAYFAGFLDYGVALRRQSPHYEILRSLLSKKFRELYFPYKWEDYQSVSLPG
ncbi:MAG: hypothetical protein JXB45_04420 [Candidatus Krumholzibacteriota bacterium]|nr:hypothetical protein [Candidatus Krumholzibacteriota bacterium]